MQIERIFYPVKTLGPGRRLGIWTIGCPHACPNCSNPELWELNPAKDISIQQISLWASSLQEEVDGVTISGGEPFEQVQELAELVQFFYEHVTQDILVYTGYTFEELLQRNDPAIDSILQHIAVLIDGKYIEEQNDNAPLRGSSNQLIHILNEKYRTQYVAIADGERQVQNIFNQRELLSIGIPRKGFRKAMATILPKHGILHRDVRRRDSNDK